MGPPTYMPVGLDFLSLSGEQECANSHAPSGLSASCRYLPRRNRPTARSAPLDMSSSEGSATTAPAATLYCQTEPLCCRTETLSCRTTKFGVPVYAACRSTGMCMALPLQRAAAANVRVGARDATQATASPRP